MKLSRYIFFVFVVTVPMAYARIWITDTVNIKIAELLYILYLIIMFRYINITNRYLLKYKILIAILFFGFIISLSLSQDFNLSIKRSAVVIFPIVFIITLPELLVPHEKYIVNYMKRSLYFVIGFALISILFYNLSVKNRIIFPSIYGFRISSYVGDPNRLGSFLNIITCLFIYEYHILKTKKTLFILLISVSFIFMTGSRASILIVLFYILFSYTETRNRSKHINWKSIIQLLFVLVIIFSLYPSISLRLDRIAQSYSNDRYDVREEIFKQGIDEFMKHPLVGSGPFTFSSDKRIVLHGIDQEATSHNMYLEVLSTMGLIGFIPYILILINMLYDLYRIKNNNDNIIYKWLYLSLVGFLIHGFVIETFTERYVWVYFSVIQYFIYKYNYESNYEVRE